MRGKHTGLTVVFLLVAVMVGSVVWLVHTQVQQEQMNRALIAAIRHNDTQMALSLLEQGANPNAHDEPTTQGPIWRLWLDKLQGKRPDPPSPLTALMVAVAPYLDKNGWEYPSDRSPIVKALLEKGADPNVSLGHGFTPLYWAAAAGVDAGDDSNRDDTIKLLLKHGAVPNPPSMLSPLQLVVMGNSPSDDVIASLLHHGANIDAQDPVGQTPLMMAVRSRKVHIVQLLLCYHANPNIAMGKVTPLFFARRYAAISEEKQIVTLLKQAGAKE